MHSYIYSVIIVMYLYLCTCTYFVFVFFSVATEVGSKKDQDHPSAAGLESKWCSRQGSLSSFSYRYIVKQKG